MWARVAILTTWKGIGPGPANWDSEECLSQILALNFFKNYDL